jgi:hypothetical protein
MARTDINFFSLSSRLLNGNRKTMFGVLFDYMHWTGGRKCGFLSSSTCFSQNIEFANDYDDQTGRMVPR